MVPGSIEGRWLGSRVGVPGVSTTTIVLNARRIVNQDKFVSSSKRSLPTLLVEDSLWEEGKECVGGLDEVGRGAWAGPVSVGITVVHRGSTIETLPAWLRDSKLLSEKRRELIFDDVARWCKDWAVGHAQADECDELGMSMALSVAARRALVALKVRPDALIVDGPYNLLHPPRMTTDQEEIVAKLAPAVIPATVHPIRGADAQCASVAAASVLAKVVRDRLMRVENVSFPQYGFDQNKGYPSPSHKIALRGYGLSGIHRRSWSFVNDLVWK